MPIKLEQHHVEKPWGRVQLPEQFGQNEGRRIGEVWFENPACELPLLVKYIFTSEKLSVQVHPNDDEARKLGHANGKTECWYILEAEPEAALALGFKTSVTEHIVRAAISEGTIEDLLHWRPVQAGDFIYVPAGTVHAIGAGISLLELQQSSDITYRLYDYGRPRELHLEEGLAVARLEPYSQLSTPTRRDESLILVDGPYFSLARVDAGSALLDSSTHHDRWIMPLRGVASSGDEFAGAGECLFVPAGEAVEISKNGRILLGAQSLG